MNRIEWSPSPGTAARHRPDQLFDITGIRNGLELPALGRQARLPRGVAGTTPIVEQAAQQASEGPPAGEAAPADSGLGQRVRQRFPASRKGKLN